MASWKKTGALFSHEQNDVRRRVATIFILFAFNGRKSVVSGYHRVWIMFHRCEKEKEKERNSGSESLLSAGKFSFP